MELARVRVHYYFLIKLTYGSVERNTPCNEHEGYSVGHEEHQQNASWSVHDWNKYQIQMC